MQICINGSLLYDLFLKQQKKQQPLCSSKNSVCKCFYLILLPNFSQYQISPLSRYHPSRVRANTCFLQDTVTERGETNAIFDLQRAGTMACRTWYSVQSVFQFNPVGLSSRLCAGHSSFSTPTATMSSWTSLCA